MTEKTRKGPSFAALAALTTLAVSLWLEVELSSALFRSVLVYLGMSLLVLGYRVILSHYLAASEERARRELLERIQKEAEEEAKKQTQKQTAAADAKKEKKDSGQKTDQHEKAPARKPEKETAEV